MKARTFTMKDLARLARMRGSDNVQQARIGEKAYRLWMRRTDQWLAAQ